MTNKEVRLKAIEELEKRGWYQGSWCNAEGRNVCMMGAVSCAIDGSPIPSYFEGQAQFCSIRAELQTELGLEFASDIYEWNDTTGRTLEEVKAALRGPQ